MANELEQREARAQELVGTVIGDRYRIDSLVGLGMMGAVFRAHHKGLGRDVALKILHEELMADPEMVGRFKREAAAISRLDHPHCVRVTDFGEVQTGGMFIAMELLQGRELAKMLDDPMPYERAMQIGTEVLDGLQHAHEQGVIHRDIKPENIYIATNAEGKEQVKILDFGIAKVQEGFGSRTLTQAGMIFGTPHYMSPEQARGTPLDHRADLYSVGILLYDLVAGRVPFDGPDPVKLLRRQIQDPPPPLPDEVPRPVQAVILKLLEKDADDRPTSAAEAKAAIERAVGLARAADKVDSADDRPTGGLTQVVETGSSGSGSDPRMVFALIGASILVTLIFIVWLVAGSGSPEEADPTADAAEPSEVIAGLVGAQAPTADDKTKDATHTAAAEVPAERATEGAAEPAPDKLPVAVLAGIDALMRDKDYGQAQTMIAPLLVDYPKSAPLLWRMGLVLTKLKGAENRVAALKSYASALAVDPSMKNNQQFGAQLDRLLDDPKLRPQAIEIAMEHLGEDGLTRLSAWVNLQKNPLSYESRHRVVDFLESNDRASTVNRPLQTAHDLWQAGGAEYPCAAFAAALDDAERNADSYLRGTLRAVAVPTSAADECAGAAERLGQARERYDTMYAGLDPVVPAHYRKRRK